MATSPTYPALPEPSWIVAFLMTTSAGRGSAASERRRKREFMGGSLLGKVSGPADYCRAAGPGQVGDSPGSRMGMSFPPTEATHAAAHVQVEDPPGDRDRDQCGLRGQP